MIKVALVGYGALGRYVEAMIADAFPVERSQTVIFDDRSTDARALPFSDHLGDAHADHTFFVCLGYKHLVAKKRIVGQLLALGRTVPHYIHPSAYVHPTVTIGAGSMIYPGCSIDRNTRIGRGTWITNADVIAHDCVIGDACWFGASVTLSGVVSVGDSTFIGSGTTVANDVEVGSEVVVGMGTAVTASIEDGKSVIGNPMRVLGRPLKLV